MYQPPINYSYLLSLPNEMLVHILSFLDGKTLCQLAQTNTVLKNIIIHSNIMRSRVIEHFRVRQENSFESFIAYYQGDWVGCLTYLTPLACTCLVKDCTNLTNTIAIARKHQDYVNRYRVARRNAGL